MSNQRKMKRQAERQQAMGNRKAVSDLSPEEKHQMRGVLANGLRDAGMTVLTKEQDGHLIVIAIPGDTEVKDESEVKVWGKIAEVLEDAAKHARDLEKVDVETLKKQTPNSKGGEA